MTASTDFSPAGPLRGAHVQTVLASAGPRALLLARRHRELVSGARDVLVDAGEGVRLHAWHTPARDPDNPRGTAVLIHGWEGHGNAPYILSAAGQLHEAGYEVYRLHLRDHGPSHHLNPGLFHANRIREVVHAVGEIGRRRRGGALFLAGFSMGGNFALRVGARAPAAGIELGGVVAICPVIDPASSLRALEEGPWVYRHYFIRKWRRSLRRKQRSFPAVLSLDDVQGRRSLTGMTDFLVEGYTPFPDTASYLAGYAITGDALASVRVPCHALLAADDPIVPGADIARARVSPAVTIEVQARGGHCGFVTNWRLQSWADQRIRERFARWSVSG